MAIDRGTKNSTSQILSQAMALLNSENPPVKLRREEVDKEANNYNKPEVEVPIVKLVLPDLHPFQQEVVDNKRRFNVVCVGRRAGKTTLGIRLGVEVLLNGGLVGWFAPTDKVLGDAWREFVRVLAPITKANGVNKTDHRIELITGGALECWTMSAEVVARSRRYHIVFVDEAAMVPNLLMRWEEEIRPTLVDFEGTGWWFSTPKGVNDFKEGYERGQDNTLWPEWASWQMPSSVNPHLPPGELEAMRKEMTSSRASQEIDAQFLSGEGYVFRNVDAVSTNIIVEYNANQQNVAGLDFGRSNDYTVVSVWDLKTKSEIYIDRFTGEDWPLQRARIKGIFNKFRIGSALAEQNSFGEANITELRNEGLPIDGFVTSNQTKRTIVEQLVVSLENKTCRLLSKDVNKDTYAAYMEMLSFEQTTLEKTGLVRYAGAAGKHDDTVMARCLAHYCIDEEPNFMSSLTGETPTEDQPIYYEEHIMPMMRNW